MVLSVVGEITFLVCACLFIFSAPIFLHAKKKPHHVEMMKTEPPPPEDHHHDHEEVIFSPHDKPPSDPHRYYQYKKIDPLYSSSLVWPNNPQGDSYYKAFIDSQKSSYLNPYSKAYSTIYRDYYKRFKRDINFQEAKSEDSLESEETLPPFEDIYLLKIAHEATDTQKPKKKISKKKKMLYLQKIIERRKRSLQLSTKPVKNTTSNSKNRKYKKNALSDTFADLFKKRHRRSVEDSSLSKPHNRLVKEIVLPESDDEIPEDDTDVGQNFYHHRLLVPVIF